jgi:uroporphyrinogen-III synthase
MRVLVTRPNSDAQTTAARLAGLGHQPLIAPLLTIEFLDGEAISMDGVQAVLATSSNGVRALARRTTRRNVALFAVGHQTAATASEAGFGSVHNADGDVVTLTETVSRTLRPKQGALLHVTGAEAEGNLARALSGTGYDVRTLVLYRVNAKAKLPEGADAAIRGSKLDAVLHFSARSARIFRDLVTRAGLEQACVELLMVCISRSASVPLETLKCRELRIAAAPNQDALLDCLN